jgi:hypothetical protein
MWQFPRLASAAGLLSAACTDAPPTAQPSAAQVRAIAVIIQAETSTGCRIELGGKSFVIPRDGDRLREAIAGLRNRVDRIDIRGPASTPYRCVGGLIFAAQRAGMQVGFAAEPPPSE